MQTSQNQKVYSKKRHKAKTEGTAEPVIKILNYKNKTMTMVK